MDPFVLTSDAFRAPWRLWTGHLTHFGWEHALLNGLALLVPTRLAGRRDRLQALVSVLWMAPLLSLLLMPGLGDGQYRGASGLACALWAQVGLRLTQRRESASAGLLLLGGLALKLSLEAALGSPFLARAEGWCTLPEAHLWGSLLGLIAALPGIRRAPHPEPRRA